MQLFIALKNKPFEAYMIDLTMCFGCRQKKVQLIENTWLIH